MALLCASCLLAQPVSADEAEAHYRLAVTLRDQGRYDDALEEINAAVDERPSYAPWHVTRGSILRHLEKYDAALRAFDRAIALAPKNGRAYGLAGAVCLRKNEPQKAVGYLRKAVELEPDEHERRPNGRPDERRPA